MTSDNTNTGDWNTGNGNTGNGNTGNRNAGDWNAGNGNTGDRNTGDWNAGDWNAGNRNAGSQNVGGWNAGNRNAGHLNSKDAPIRMFNRECPGLSREDLTFPNFFYFQLTLWVDPADMTDAEKLENPSYKVTEGFLKTRDYKEAFQASYDAADAEDRARLPALPNFDADVFYDISGIQVGGNSRVLGKIEALEKELAALKAEVAALKAEVAS